MAKKTKTNSGPRTLCQPSGEEHGQVVYENHYPGKLIMMTANVKIYPCKRCGIVYWEPK